ncbi:hypothetical protein ACFLZS_00445 [Patescibacteria group bacterium]
MEKDQKIQNPDGNITKKSSKKWIFGLLILFTLVIALGIFGYFKWFIPYQIENYVTKSVNDYNSLQDDLDEVSTAFKDLEILETDSVNQTTTKIDSAIESTSRVLANENDRDIPDQAKELHNKLITYYDDVNEALKGIEDFTDYFKELAPVINNLSESSISTQEGNSDQVESILTNARSVQKKLGTDLEKLNQINAPSDLDKLHNDFSEFLESYNQFVSDLIEALKVEDYDQIETLTEQEENEQNEYSDEFEKDIDSFEKNSQISSWSEDLTEQEKNIEDLVSELKLRYKGF